MNDKTKKIEIEERTYIIHKFDAKTSLKAIKRLISKIMPIFDQGSLTAETLAGNIGDAISINSISRALDEIEDKDLDYLFDTSLKHAFLVLPNGDTVQVMNNNGLYGVDGIEYDLVLVLRLIIEAVVLSVQGFTDASRLASILAPAFGSLASIAST